MKTRTLTRRGWSWRSSSTCPTAVRDAGQMASHVPFGLQTVPLLVLTNRLPRVPGGSAGPPSCPSICSSIGNSQSPPDELESPPSRKARGQTTCGDTFLTSHCFLFGSTVGFRLKSGISGHKLYIFLLLRYLFDRELF